MATNKFATMLHRNTNKTTLVLVYAILEWILIILLLLNSLFSYLIIKFVDYFGLKRPCMWCTRIDHIIEPHSNNFSCRDFVCEAHAFEISKLGFCLNHRKLAESETMCEDCSSLCHSKFVNLYQSFGLFPWMKDKGMLHDADADDSNKVLENGMEVKPLRCSCCGVKFVRKFYLIRDKPFLRVLDYTQKQNLITERGVEGRIGDGHHHSYHGRDGFVLDHLEEEHNTVENKGSDMLFDVSVCSVCGENYKMDLGIGKGKEGPIREEETLNVPKGDQPCEETTNHVAFTSENTEQIPPKHLEFSIHGDDCSLIPDEFGDSFATKRENQPRYDVGDERPSGDEDVVLDFDINSGAVFQPVIENGHISASSVESETGIGFSGPECAKVFKANEVGSRSEILEPDYQEVNFAQTTEDSSINGNVEAVPEGSKQMQGYELEAEVSTQSKYILEDSSKDDTVENLYQLHKELLLLGREESGTEESLEGSLMTDIECGKLTIERLKSALKAERKALSTLYVELEEERSASAVAANQAMAMINRLQEEKAAMRMEALQYERVMEEQSEYDQEALQLLNELIIEREKEKLELEKELEIYRKKVLEYEVREKMMISRRESNRRSRTSPSFSNARDSDGLSIDLSRDTKEGNGICRHQEFSNPNTHEDAAIYLEESMEMFEEERLFILNQLKTLKEKLVTLNYEEEYFDGIKSVEHLCDENGNGYQDHNDYCIDHVNGLANGKHNDGSKTKSNELDFTSLQNCSDEKVQLEKKLDIEIEVDHIFERLQALEADREFLKLCISSLKIGDRGLDLIQEILQNLRDLRNVEQRIKNMRDVVV